MRSAEITGNEKQYKELLVVESARLFHQYGIRSVNLEFVFRKLGISRKEFHEYFTDKNDLVATVISSQLKQHKEELQTALKTGNAIEQALIARNLLSQLLQRFTVKTLYELEKYYSSVYEYWTDYKENWLLKACKQNLVTGIKEGLYRQSINIDLIALYLVKRVMENKAEEFSKRRNLRIEEVKKQLTQFELSGICSDKGRAFLEEKLAGPL